MCGRNERHASGACCRRGACTVFAVRFQTNRPINAIRKIRRRDDDDVVGVIHWLRRLALRQVVGLLRRGVLAAAAAIALTAVVAAAATAAAARLNGERRDGMAEHERKCDTLTGVWLFVRQSGRRQVVLWMYGIRMIRGSVDRRMVVAWFAAVRQRNEGRTMSRRRQNGRS